MASETELLSTQEQFRNRLYNEWLPTYCADKKRGYSVEGFVSASANVNAEDARDFMRAIDRKLVNCDSGGRYSLPRSKATEVIFWEHERTIIPRRITLWLEPIITIAAVARLHMDYGWPLECLGMQSQEYAFDLTAFLPGSASEHIAGEVKKTAKELDTLMENLDRCCAEGAHDQCLQSSKRRNAHKKWLGLGRSQAPLFWAIGPGGCNRVYRVSYAEGRAVSLTQVNPEELGFR